jgi:hypothetical protein
MDNTSDDARGDSSENKKVTNRKPLSSESRGKKIEKLKRLWRDPEYREKAIKATREGKANKKKARPSEE